MKKIIGIDPGIKGVAIVIDRHTTVLDVINFPTASDSLFQSKPDALALYNKLSRHAEESIAVIEKVGAMPTDARSSLWSFAENHGVWISCLAIAGIPIVSRVSPVHWKAHYRLIKKPKNESKAKALELGFKAKNHNEADAFLIACYYRFLMPEP